MKRKQAVALVFALSVIASMAFAQAGKSGKGSISFAFVSQTPVPVPTPAFQRITENPLLQLKALLPPVGVSVDESMLINIGAVRRYRVLQIEWKSYKDASGKDAPDVVEPNTDKYKHVKELKVLESFTRDGTLQQKRSLLNLQNEVLVIAVDADAHLLWWDPLGDPRLVRAEGFDADGTIHGQEYHYSKTTILVDAPEDADITELRFYLTRWTGQNLILEPLYVVPFNENKKSK